MKAYITQAGVLRVVGETGTERFALSQWSYRASIAGEEGLGHRHGFYSSENMVIGGDSKDEEIK